MTDRPLVFLGTPATAATILESLLRENRRVVRVITGPDRRRGRGMATSPTPVKEVAIRHSIPVDHDLSWFETDIPPALLGIVVAYGRIIPARILHKVPMWNVHFSLLPRWRGAAPVARAILAGDEVTGVCIMEMDEGLDTGGVIARSAVSISPADTTDSLTASLAAIGSRLLAECLDAPDAKAVAQVGEPVYAHKIEPSEGAIDWSNAADHIARQVRALRAFTLLDGRRVRILEVDLLSSVANDAATGAIGTVDRDLVVRTGDGAIRLVRVQPEGKPAQSAMEWIRGVRADEIRFDQPRTP